ncbi:MAG: hypothetical protein M1570_16520 [Chloroflexi bacterium]|nr:hypothetical protein [Chloroflexota bacterium]
MSAKRRTITIPFGLAVFALMVTIGLSHVMAEPPSPELVVDQQFQTWGYKVWVEQDGYTSAEVSYKQDNVEDLRGHANLNKALAQQLRAKGTKEFRAIVTFRHPVLLNEFRTWAAQNRIAIDAFTLRVLAEDGSRVTLGAVPSGGQLVDEPHLNRVVDLVAKRGASDLKGVFSVEGVIRSADYEGIAASRTVFMVDITKSAVLSQVSEMGRGLLLKPSAIRVFPTFPRMEDLGIQNFQ